MSDPAEDEIATNTRWAEEPDPDLPEYIRVSGRFYVPTRSAERVELSGAAAVSRMLDLLRLANTFREDLGPRLTPAEVTAFVRLVSLSVSTEETFPCLLFSRGYVFALVARTVGTVLRCGLQWQPVGTPLPSDSAFLRAALSVLGVPEAAQDDWREGFTAGGGCCYETAYVVQRSSTGAPS